MQMDDPLEEIRKAIKAFKEKAYERKMRSRAKANDKYNPKCPKCGCRTFYTNKLASKDVLSYHSS